MNDIVVENPNGDERRVMDTHTLVEDDTNPNVKQFGPVSVYPVWGTPIQDSEIKEYLNYLVEEKLQHLLRQRELREQFRNIKESDAKREITSFILEQGKHGINRLSIFDISVALRIPAEQVEKIMDKFAKGGLVKEAHD